MNTPLYIKDFGEVFHYAAATKHPDVKWRRQPVTHNSARYRMLMATQQGRDAYAVFMGIVDLVVRHRREDGALTDDAGRPITAAVVSASTGIPLSVCRRAFLHLQSVDVAWLTDRRPIDVPSTDDRPDVSPEQNRTERDKRREEVLSKPGEATNQEEASPIRLALIRTGMSEQAADLILTHPRYDETKVRHALAQLRANKEPVRLPHRFILVQAGMEDSAKHKHARVTITQQLAAARLREGAKA